MDGRKFVSDAIRAGARVIVSDRSVSTPANVARIRVTDAAAAAGILSSLIHGSPSDRLRVFGVTGTNGKTTTTYLIRHIQSGMGQRAALLGTVHEEIPGLPPVPSALTTPDSPEIQRFLRRAVDAGCRSAVFEVSSHSLDQRRAWGIGFDTVVFTNLTQDHLDYHRTMEKYFNTKKRLFTDYPYLRAVVNMDDPFGRRLAAILRRGKGPHQTLVTYGRHPQSDIRILSSKSGLQGITAKLSAWRRPLTLRLRLIGDYNLSNAAAALAACASPADVRQVACLLARADAPPGRMQIVDVGQSFVTLVDYAHTPDAIEKLLGACRRLKPRRLLCVFGCGGDRDRTKRPKMGRIATTLADLSFVTSDNPRTEDPHRIIDDIRPGLRGREGHRYIIEPDRRRAIEAACRVARRGDILAIAGKGHEDYQIIGAVKEPFDDRNVARAAIRGLRKTSRHSIRGASC